MHKVKFNGVELNDYIFIKYIKDSILPPTSTIRAEVPKRVGSYFQRIDLEEREIVVGYEIISNSDEDRLDTIETLSSTLLTETEVWLELRDRKKYKASLSGMTEIEEVMYDGNGEFVFLATDPIAYGQEKILSAVAGAITLVVTGNYKTKPTYSLTFTADTSFAEIRNITDGKYIRINHAFVNGDVLLIDYNGKWKTKKNGVVIDEDLTIESDFAPLKPGMNQITFLPANATTIMTYEERWL